MKKDLKLQFGKVRGQHRLPQKEEQKMAEKGEQWVRQELLRELNKTFAMTMLEMVSWEVNNRKLLNSLIWIHVQLAPVRIVNNLRILMGWSNLTTINKLAAKTDMNASFLSRLINMTTIGGWNTENVLRISATLGADPRLLLFSDLEAVIREQNEVSKSWKPTG